MMKTFVYVTSAYFAYLEWLQILDKTDTYFFEFTNWTQLVSPALYIVLILKNDFFDDQWYDFQTQKDLAAIAIIFVWYNVFYWMRLFDATAFFINLLEETFVGIKGFLKMMLILILAFANIVYIINLANQDDEEQESADITENVSNGLANALIHTYLLSLGDFDYKNFEGEHQAVLWVLFIAATFLL